MSLDVTNGIINKLMMVTDQGHRPTARLRFKSRFIERFPSQLLLASASMGVQYKISESQLKGLEDIDSN